MSKSLFTVSDEFLAALKSSGRTGKEVALAIGCPVVTLYKICERALGVKLGDPRVMAACALIGFNPGEAFVVRFPEQGVRDGEE